MLLRIAAGPAGIDLVPCPPQEFDDLGLPTGSITLQVGTAAVESAALLGEGGGASLPTWLGGSGWEPNSSGNASEVQTISAVDEARGRRVDSSPMCSVLCPGASVGLRARLAVPSSKQHVGQRDLGAVLSQPVLAQSERVVIGNSSCWLEGRGKVGSGSRALAWQQPRRRATCERSYVFIAPVVPPVCTCGDACPIPLFASTPRGDSFLPWIAEDLAVSSRESRRGWSSPQSPIIRKSARCRVVLEVEGSGVTLS